MFNKVGTVSIFVSDQQRAKQFYTEVLGFELRMDAPLGPESDARWIAVAPKGGQTELLLYLPDENWSHYKDVVGKPQPVTLDVSDIQHLYEDLKAKGVVFSGAPEPQPWGTFTTFQDSEGNYLLMVEQPQRGGE